MVDILLPSNVIQHEGRVFQDLVNREKKASTALGRGVVVPHVRTKHVRDIAIGFGRSDYPVEWDTPDKEPVDLFFVMVTPPFDDTIYNRLWPKMASILYYDKTLEDLRNATEPGEIIGIIKREESLTGG